MNQSNIINRFSIEHDTSSSTVVGYLTPPKRPNTGDQRKYLSTQKPIPTEIAQLILSHSPDAFTLKNLVLSSPIFYRSFLTARNAILKDILHNEFRPSILPDALATFYSGHTPLGKDSKVEHVLSRYDNPGLIHIECWSLSDALELSKIHDDVDYFASDYASTLSRHPVTACRLSEPVSLRPHELDRIKRVLYRFELYCNCFRKDDNLDRGLESPQERREMFLNAFSPWENEQLNTIYEYLYRKLSVRMFASFDVPKIWPLLTVLAYNDVARHDVEWGEFSIPFYYNTHPPDNDRLEHYLSLGLSFVRKLVTVPTYDERYRLLLLEHKKDETFMYITLSEMDYSIGKPIAGLTEADRAALAKPMSALDPDKGPAEAWFWAYYRENMAQCYALGEQKQLRERGYVMFDYDRLARWEVFDQQFTSTIDRDSSEMKARHKEMHDSWRKRSKVWQNGGRGWWSEDDQSKLIWIRNNSDFARHEESKRKISAQGKYSSEPW